MCLKPYGAISARESCLNNENKRSCSIKQLLFSLLFYIMQVFDVAFVVEEDILSAVDIVQI